MKLNCSGPYAIFSILRVLAVTILFTSLTVSAENCASAIPEQDGWDFARVVMSLDMSPIQKVEILTKSCRIFDIENKAGVLLNDLNVIPWWTLGRLIVLAEIPDAFRSLIKDSSFRHFNQRMLEIRSKPKALDRVKQIYDLVALYKKPYDAEYAAQVTAGKISKQRPIILTPEQTLKFGGVCRDFARLLRWALIQVARSSSSDPIAEVFSVSMKVGMFQDGTGHAWVRVMIPNEKIPGQLTQFSQIDLDVTNFEKRFTPLPPIGSQWSNRQRQNDFLQCQNLIYCLSGPQ